MTKPRENVSHPFFLWGLFLPATPMTEVGPNHFSYFKRTIQTPVHPLTDKKSLFPFFAYCKKLPDAATLVAILQLHSSEAQYKSAVFHSSSSSAYQTAMANGVLSIYF